MLKKERLLLLCRMMSREGVVWPRKGERRLRAGGSGVLLRTRKARSSRQQPDCLTLCRVTGPAFPAVQSTASRHLGCARMVSPRVGVSVIQLYRQLQPPNASLIRTWHYPIPNMLFRHRNIWTKSFRHPAFSQLVSLVWWDVLKRRCHVQFVSLVPTTYLLRRTLLHSLISFKEALHVYRLLTGSCPEALSSTCRRTVNKRRR